MIQPRFAFPSRHIARWRVFSAFCAAILLLSPAVTSRRSTRFGKALEQGEQKQAAQDYRGAVACYEKALGGASRSADAHFRLGILYDQKLNDPLERRASFPALRRVAPKGPHAKEARQTSPGSSCRSPRASTTARSSAMPRPFASNRKTRTFAPRWPR